MEPPSQAELVCLYVHAVEADDEAAGGRAWAHPGAGSEDGVPPRTVQGIAAGLALDRQASARRIGLLSTLDDLEADGLVAREQARTDGGTTRSIYRLTEAGREHARELRERFRSETVTLADSTTDAVEVAELEGYFDSYPLVRALARLDDGTLRLQDDVGGEFVDRETELEDLRALLETVPQEGSRTVLVSGPAGVGKTTLVERWLPAAREAGFAVGVGRCRLAGDRPYGALRAAFGDLPGGGAMADPLESPALVADDPETYEAQRTALFNEVADRVRDRAREQPLVVFLDDLQWASRDTRELFAHLTGAVTDWLHPVLFVATYRSEVAAADEGFDAVVRGVADADRTIRHDLGPLPASDSRGLVAWLADTPDLPDAFLEAVRERTGGNPLLLRATVQQLVDAGVVDPADPADPDLEALPTSAAALPVPGDVRAVLESRLEALPAATRRVLGATAVAGATVDPALVAAVLGESEATVNDHLDVLVTGRFLERTGERVAFVGGLVREGLLEGMDPDRRRDLHASVAEAVQATTSGAAEEWAARVAHHYEEAGDLAAAQSFYRRAGDRAREVYAHEDAVEAYERALAIARERGEEAAAVEVLVLLGETTATLGRFETAREHLDAAGDLSDDPATIQRLHLREAETYATQGDFEAAIETADAGLALAADEGDPAAVAGLLGVEAKALTETGRPEAAREAAIRARDRAREADAPEQEVVALRELGNVAVRQGALADAGDALRESLELAREIDARPEEAAARNSLGAVALQRGNFERATEHLEDALAIYRDVGDPHGEAQCLNNLGTGAELRNDLDDAEAYLRESLARYRELGDRAGEASSLGNLGLVARKRGDLADAVTYYERSRPIYREIGNVNGEANAVHNLGTVARLRGDLDAAADYYDRSLALERDIGDRAGEANTLTSLGLVARARGELDAAAACFEESLALDREIGDGAGEANNLAELAHVAARRGDLDEAIDHVEEALRVADAAAATGPEGAALLARGIVARERGDLEAAADAVREGLDRLRAVEDQEREIRGLVVLARVASDRGDAAAAADRARAALERARDLGFGLLEVRVHETLAAVAEARGEPATAREHAEAALALLEDFDTAALADRADALRERVDRLAETGDGDGTAK